MELEDGIFLKAYRDKFDIYRIQLYNYIVMEFGEVKNMNGLQMLETGVGRGGGLHHIVSNLNP